MSLNALLTPANTCFGSANVRLGPISPLAILARAEYPLALLGIFEVQSIPGYLFGVEFLLTRAQLGCVVGREGWLLCRYSFPSL